MAFMEILEGWSGLTQAFEQDLLRQETMMRAGSGFGRHVDFDPLGDPFLQQQQSHPRRNNSRDDLSVRQPPQRLSNLPAREFKKSDFCWYKTQEG